MTLIELGEVSSSSDRSDEPRERPFRRVEIRRGLAVLITLLCLVGVAGSERPDAPGLPVLWSVPFAGDMFAMTADGLFVVQPGEPSRLIRYEPRTGEEVWSKDLPAYTGWFTTEAPGLVLLPSASGPDPSLVAAGPPRTMALDAATGEVRWEADGEVSLARPDTLLMSAGDPERPESRRLRLIRASDAGVIWELKQAGDLSGWTTIGPDREPPTGLVTVTDAGQVEIRRYTDGTLLTTGTVPWYTPRPDADGEDFAFLTGGVDTMFVTRSLNGQQEIFAYDTASLEPLWQVESGFGYGISPCGPVICVNSETDGLQGLDPRSGRQVWEAEDLAWAQPLRNGQLAAQGRNSPHGALIDPATGRVEADLGDILNVVEVAPDRLLVLQFNRFTPMDAKISELGRDNRLHVRDVLRGVGGGVDCRAWDGLLVCGVPGGQNGGPDAPELTVRDVG